MIKVLAMMMVGLAMFFMPGAVSVQCPPWVVDLNVVSATDIHTLRNAFNCTGQGTFIVTWHSSLHVGRTIEVANMKNVSITGSGFPTIHGGPTAIDPGVNFDSKNGTGIFKVVGGSTLRLSYLVLAAGNSQSGGAVDILETSSLFVSGCTFINNNASYGGETSACR